MVNDAKKLFVDTFGSAPEVLSRAPGRVEVLGNHTDYNEGYVLSAAIDKAVYAAASKSPDGKTFELVSGQFGEVVRIGDPARHSEHAWTKYPLGVYAILKQGGYPVAPIRLAIQSDIPPGTGLSSSAALEVSTALCLRSLFGFTVAPVDLAKICQRAENEFVGANCGLLDQFTSLLGEANRVLFIDFRTLAYKTIALPSPDVCLAVSTSGVIHQLVQSAYNDRRRECAAAAQYFGSVDPNVKTLRDVSMDTLLRNERHLPREVFKRARHIVGEDERVLQGIELLQKGELSAFGRLLYRSHESSRLNFENSCPELDVLVSIARTIPGVYGSRLTGGGFGGATLTILDATRKAEFEKAIVEQYRSQTGRDTTVRFASIADGARVMSNTD